MHTNLLASIKQVIRHFRFTDLNNKIDIKNKRMCPGIYSNENESCMRVDERRLARVCMRVFSTLVSWSNENKSCMRVDESRLTRVCTGFFSTLMSWSTKNKSHTKVDKSREARVCVRVFSTLMS